MKKSLMVFAVVLLAVAIAIPAFAVEFKYGGSWRGRYVAENNVFDGFDPGAGGAAFTKYNGDDNRTYVDYRIRMYFTFEGSKNLKVVTAFEIGDAIFGQGGSPGGTSYGANTGHNEGANVGGDAVSVEVKNVYAQFNIPNTPTTGLFGLMPLNLLSGWIVNDDLPAIVLLTKLDPFKVTIGYVGGQNGWERRFTDTLATTSQTFNVDDAFIALDYASGPLKGTLTFFAEDGHDSVISMDPRTLATPIRNFAGGPDSNGFDFLNDTRSPSDNMLFDLGFNLTYKVDWLLAYVNFVRNFGSVDLNSVVPGVLDRSVDYEGWMIDAGLTYYCAPFTVNIGGFYTTGPEISDDAKLFSSNTLADGSAAPFRNLQSKNVDWFVTPAGTSKAFSEIIGGGILGEDLHIVRGFPGTVKGSSMGSPSGLNTVFWRGYYNPTNLWTVTLGGSWQVAEKTKLSASYWYFGTSEDVPVAWNSTTDTFKMSSSIGHELDFYLDQGIVDGLTLTLVGAYLIADDAFAPIPTTNYSSLPMNSSGTQTKGLASDAYELGFRLQWTF
jgi:hypothetical protein